MNRYEESNVFNRRHRKIAEFIRDLKKLVDLSPSALAELPELAFCAFEAPTRAEEDLLY